VTSPTAALPELELAAIQIAGESAADGLISRWETNDGSPMAGYRAAGAAWIVIPGIAAFRFADDGPVVARPDGASETMIREAWLRSVLPLVVQARGFQVLHASAISTGKGVLAICGVSTSGKSTLAAAMHARGHVVVADDALGFAPADEVVLIQHDVRPRVEPPQGAGTGVIALTLPFQVRLRPAPAALLDLPDVVVAGAGGAAIELRHIVILDPDTAEPAARVTREAASAAVGSLMPHAYCFALDEEKEALVRAYALLADRVSIWRLRYPPDIERLDETVSVLEGLLDA
jgi:hypothetical protein